MEIRNTALNVHIFKHTYILSIHIYLYIFIFKHPFLPTLTYNKHTVYFIYEFGDCHWVGFISVWFWHFFFITVCIWNSKFLENYIYISPWSCETTTKHGYILYIQYTNTNKYNKNETNINEIEWYLACMMMFQSIPPDPTAQIIIDTTLNWRDKLFWPKLTVYTNDKSKLIYPREIND